MFRNKSDLSAAMEAVDRDMSVTIRSLAEFDTDRLRENLSLERDSMRESLGILNVDIDRMIAWRDDRARALAVVETALEGLGEGEAVEVIKAVAADIRPRPVTHHAGFTTTPKGKSHTSVEFDNPPWAEPEPA